jgi:hypothetical protein
MDEVFQPIFHSKRDQEKKYSISFISSMKFKKTVSPTFGAKVGHSLSEGHNAPIQL